jgi:TolA-binding protein
MRQNLIAFALFYSLLPFATAQAQPMIQSQEGIALENQILALQNQLQQIQAGGGNGGSSLGGGSAAPAPAGGTSVPPSIVTSLLSQVSQLQAQVQQLNGQVDELQNQVNTQHDATEKEIGDLKFQMTGGAPAAPGAPGAPATPGAPQALGGTLGTLPAAAAATAPAASTAPPASPKAALAAGRAALAKHDYASAEANARSILATAKTSPEGYQAQFLLAQALAGEGKPQDAAIAYDDAYNRSRTGSNAPASLLGLANSLTDINQASAACDTLASLNSQFPTPPAGLAPQISAASRRAHCS